MIVGSSLTIEIGDRTLLRDASFVVGAGEKVGLVGRNGTGKSTFISVIIDEPGHNVRSTGSAAIRGTYSYLPQVPVAHGLGPRAHRLLPRPVRPGPRCPRRRPQQGPRPDGQGPEQREHRAVLRPRGAVPRERRLRGRVHHGPPGRRPGPSPGAPAGGHREPLGWPAPPGRPDPDPLPGARHHDPGRAHQPPRPAGQALADGGAGAVPRGHPGGQPRPQAARPVHQQGAPPVRRTPARVQGHLLLVHGPVGGRPEPAGAVRPARGSGDQAAVHAGRLHAGKHQPTGPDRQITGQAGRAARVGQDRGAQAREEELVPPAHPPAVRRGPAAGHRPDRPLRHHHRAAARSPSTAGGATGR